MQNKNIYGWLSPSGKFIATEQYGHLKNLDSHKEFEFIETMLQSGKKELESIREECEERAEREGDCQAEWHIYEMASDKFKESICRLIYKNGFLRVSLQNGIMYFEGTSKAVKNSYTHATIFAERYSAQPKFDVITLR